MHGFVEDWTTGMTGDVTTCDVVDGDETTADVVDETIIVVGDGTTVDVVDGDEASIWM